MNDVMLYARLKMLGMADQKAWELAAKIRDTFHPIAAVAAAKIHAANKASGGAMGAIPVTNQATKSSSMVLTGATTGAAIGSVFPVVGTVIGAAVGAVVGAIGSLFGPAKEGQAALTWDDVVSHGYEFSQLGRALDERYIAEAAKGAMDKNGNMWIGCGKNGYKNPDCFYGPMAKVIVQGYLAKKVPLSASTSDVFQQVVIPWLQSGAGGTFAWAQNNVGGHVPGNPYSGQMMLIQQMVDRYLAGLPITRANMASYAGQGYTDDEPSLNVALAPLLQTTSAPSTSPSVALAQAPSTSLSGAIAAAAAKLAAPAISGGVIPTAGGGVANISSVATPNGVTPATIAPLTPQQDTTAALLAQILANQNANMVSPQAQQLVSDVAANGVQQTDLGPPSAFDLSSVPIWAWLGGGLLALYLAVKK